MNASSDSDCAQLPLCETTPTDDVTQEEEERREDVAVLTSEGGVRAPRTQHEKRNLYELWPRLPKLRLGSCRWRQGTVLMLGILLTLVALTLVVVGAVKSRHHTSLKLLHVRHPADFKSLMSIGEENFTFAQLLELNNFALDKPSFQSSDSKRGKQEEAHARAGNAVDGDLETCSSTGLERSPVWWVDLLTNKTVRSVRMYGNTVNRPRNLHVYVSSSKSNVSSSNICGIVTAGTSSLDVRIKCKEPSIGRFVVVELQTRDDTYQSLALCELMVFQ